MSTLAVFQTFPVAIDKVSVLSQTMTKDQTIPAALQVTDILIILAKALKNGTLGRNACDSHKEPAVGTNLPLVEMNGRQPKLRFAVNPKPQLFSGKK